MMNILERSLHIALKAYVGQKDKAGQTYILHPLRVMSKMDTEDEMSVALLHDVIEDSSYSASDLISEGIPQHIVEAVELLTKLNGEDYEAFIMRVRQNPLATKIKKADIEDNINVLRLRTLNAKDLARIEKYHKAWNLLNTPI